MQKILFIVPPHIRFEDYINPLSNSKRIKKGDKYFGSLLTDMPQGIFSISSYIKQFYNDLEIELIDFNIVLNKLKEFNYDSFKNFFTAYLHDIKYIPDVIGISSLFINSFQSTVDIANICKNKFPNSIIVSGGCNAQNMSKEILESCAGLDALCYGEGEIPFKNLLMFKSNKVKKLYLKNSLYWITKEDISDHIYSFIGNLDEIPFYDYGICNVEDYDINPAITSYVGVKDKEKNFHVSTSRGCPNKCSFCASNTVHGRKLRYYSIGRIKQDFLRLKEQFGAKSLVFQDDHLMKNKKRAFEILEYTKSIGLNVVLQNGLALHTLDRECLIKLKEIGINHLMLPIESGSDRVLNKLMHKPLTTKIIKQVTEDCRELGFYTDANILIGSPGETKEDINESISFLKTLPVNWYIILIVSPLSGSEVFKICKENNYFKYNYMECEFKRAIIETQEFTTEYIQEKSYLMNLELNFINNADLRLGDYETALKGFENVIVSRHDHAFANFYIAECYKKMKQKEKNLLYYNKAKELFQQEEWKKYVRELNFTEELLFNEN
jgi:radical SAM superfamily enzyme YgiQ (UPF0313 family)